MLDPKTKRQGYSDLLLSKGKILSIWEILHKEQVLRMAEQVGESLESFDAAGKYVAPGLVDIHVHFREPGFTYKEDIATGSQAAIQGGFTTVILMANTNPVIDSVEMVEKIYALAKKAPLHVLTCATVTKHMQGVEINDYVGLSEAGAVGFTDDGIPLVDAKILQMAMEQLALLKKPISLHEEYPSLIANNGMHSHIAKTHFSLMGSPREAEIFMVKRDLAMAISTGAIVNIQHISAKESIELLREAKTQSNLIHGEATPHHFSLTEEAILTKGTLAKMNPPLRREEDRQAIIRGLKENVIDIIATDHAPHTKEEKDRVFQEAPSGIIGLETSLSLGIMNLVTPGHLTYLELLEKMTCNPATLYGIDAGCLYKNGPGDIVIFSPEKEYLYEKSASKSTNSPFLGETLQGQVEATIVNGKIVYEKIGNEKIGNEKIGNEKEVKHGKK